ncbi:thioredoxin family protein [Pontiellaceae bacterium B1224]|nr:thioredoxin family protein [Pontiellaceae bacterium B1224]
MKIIGWTCLCFTLLSLVGFAEEGAASGKDAVVAGIHYAVPKYDSKRDPAADLKAAAVIASKEGKNILVQVGGDWCGWCGTLSEYFKENKAVNAVVAKNYVIMKVSIDNENRNEAFLATLPKVNAVPHLFVFDGKGKLLHSQNTGPLEKDGSYDEAKMLAFLNKWVPKNNPAVE